MGLVTLVAPIDRTHSGRHPRARRRAVHPEERIARITRVTRHRSSLRIALTTFAALATLGAAQPCDPVADGARVRAQLRAEKRDARTTYVGTALGWTTPTPRLVTTGGDTLPLTAEHRTWVSRGRTANRLVGGAFLGWLAGITAIVADCGLASTCGEQNPVALLGLGLGAAIGSRFHRERWMPVSPATSLACAALRDPG
jgi:hypothetical protein